MRQLTYLSPGRFEWRDMAAPRLQADTDAIVRPLAVARCDLDLYIATGVVPYGGPMAFGHETVAEVVEAGEAAGVTPGQRVIVPFQLSCGRCDACARGWTNSCRAYPFASAYGLKKPGGEDFGGALSERMRVPFADHMLLTLPAGVDAVTAASAADNIPDGWRAVAGPLRERPGGSVLVVGGLAQSVGLYAAGCAVALGAGRTLYLDDRAEHRRRAEAMGATAEPLSLGDGREPSEQFDIVVEAAGAPAALAFAVRSCTANGVLTSVAIHLGETTPVPLFGAYYKGLTFHTGRVHARATLPDVLACLGCGGLHPEHVTHRMVGFGEGAEAMDDPGPKLVFSSEGW